MWIRYGFKTAPPADIRMHHVALDWSRPDNGNLHGDIVKAARPQPGQGCHLRARFHLEQANGIGFAEHVVDALVIARAKIGEVDLHTTAAFDVGEGKLNSIEHA